VQAFVVNEVNGTWDNAQEVPGIAALNTGGKAQLTSVSCTSAGNCSAGGYYTDKSSHIQAFVVNEVDGTWGTAQEVPGIAAFNTGGNATVMSVSCASAGNCSAGGYFASKTGGNPHTQAFVVNEVSGTWGTAQHVAAGLDAGGFAQVGSVSCPSPGNCSAGGYASPNSVLTDAYVLNEVNGKWGTAEVVPGTAKLNTGGAAAVNSVSCSSPGHCGAGGSYRLNPLTSTSADAPAFVVSET
jgi:hypothetical protein